MLTTSSWWSTLIPFSRSVLTISKWPSAAALWSAVCPVCNKQVKEKLNFTSFFSGQNKCLKQVILRHANLSKNMTIPTQYLLEFFLFLGGFSICYFFDLSLSQHYKQLLKIVSVVFLQALRVFFCKILQKFGTILTTNYIGMY